MSLSDRTSEALKQAMKAQDEARKRTIRAIKAQILLLKTDGSGEEITEEKEIKLLQKMVKQREESLSIYQAQGREDLAAIEQEELAIIKEFLPQMLSETEVEAILKEIIASVGASTAKDMGKVMGVATKQLAGKADGKMISELTKKLLA
jgi:uncharacterized protein YqeY